MTIDVVFAGMAVADLGAALAWYGRLFGRRADVVVSDGGVMWRLAASAWLCVVGDPGRARHALVTVSVTDLDGTVADIEDRGITSAPAGTIAGAGRKATVTDPEGDTITHVEMDSASR